MADFRIACIRKPNRASASEHITHAGNQLNGGTSNWVDTREQIIQWIESKQHAFHVIDPRNEKISYVEVVKDGIHHPYIRTRADGDWNDNLLSLPECK